MHSGKEATKETHLVHSVNILFEQGMLAVGACTYTPRSHGTFTLHGRMLCPPRTAAYASSANGARDSRRLMACASAAHAGRHRSPASHPHGPTRRAARHGRGAYLTGRCCTQCRLLRSELTVGVPCAGACTVRDRGQPTQPCIPAAWPNAACSTPGSWCQPDDTSGAMFTCKPAGSVSPDNAIVVEWSGGLSRFPGDAPCGPTNCARLLAGESVAKQVSSCPLLIIVQAGGGRGPFDRQGTCDAIVCTRLLAGGPVAGRHIPALCT